MIWHRWTEKRIWKTKKQSDWNNFCVQWSLIFYSLSETLNWFFVNFGFNFSPFAATDNRDLLDFIDDLLDVADDASSVSSSGIKNGTAPTTKALIFAFLQSFPLLYSWSEVTLEISWRMSPTKDTMTSNESRIGLSNWKTVNWSELGLNREK